MPMENNIIINLSIGNWLQINNFIMKQLCKVLLKFQKLDLLSLKWNATNIEYHFKWFAMIKYELYYEITNPYVSFENLSQSSCMDSRWWNLDLIFISLFETWVMNFILFSIFSFQMCTFLISLGGLLIIWSSMDISWRLQDCIHHT